jgi:regulator of replication initiation timing
MSDDRLKSWEDKMNELTKQDTFLTLQKTVEALREENIKLRATIKALQGTLATVQNATQPSNPENRQDDGAVRGGVDAL